MARSTAAVWTVSLAATLAAGCGGSSSPPPANNNVEATTVAGPPKPWVEMTIDEKRDYMAEHVLPTMSELFTAYDPVRYAGFSCKTCHGNDAREQGFHMPNGLPPLWPSGTPEQQQMVRQHPDMARFMFNRVLPTMTQLLGQPAWDNVEKTGFSCYNCHPHAESTP